MFGANTIVGRKYFAEAPAGKLFVTSIFYTLQGEGPYAGRPAVFVRLAMCNLACSFCDTFFDAGDWMSHAEIREKIDSSWASAMPAERPGIVITGGEPALQGPELIRFLEGLQGYYPWYQIESNGTIPIDGLPSLVTLVVSPKCVEEAGVPTRYLRPGVTMLARADCLKFVMSAPHLRWAPYSEVPDWAHDFARGSVDWGQLNACRPVYISPMNIYNHLPAKAKAMRWVGKEAAVVPDLHMRSTVDEVVSFWEPGLLNMEKNQANHEYAARYCLQHGFRLSLQLHLYAGLA